MATAWGRCCANTCRTRFLALLAIGLAAVPTAQAQPAFGTALYGVYAEGGAGVGNSPTTAMALGFTWHFGTARALWGGLVTTYGDVFLSEWRARQVMDGKQVDYSQVGAIASARYRFDAGHSPWFIDAGIGVSTMDRTYQTPDHRFSTRFQFTPVLSAGRNFGSKGAHELSLRLQHFSNGGIREPNPGENFVRLRYLYRF